MGAKRSTHFWNERKFGVANQSPVCFKEQASRLAHSHMSFDFLGYRPSIGELIVVAILAVLAEQVGRLRLILRAFAFTSDLAAASSARLRLRQIQRLESRIEWIGRYQQFDPKSIMNSLRRIFEIIVITLTLVILLILADIMRSEVLFAQLFYILV
jgi:hypothetical protein